MRYKYVIAIVFLMLVSFVSISLINAKSQSPSKLKAISDPDTSLSEQKKRIQQLNDFIDEVRGLPAEFSGDLLLKLVEGGKVLESKSKVDLLEEVFRNSRDAQNPLKRIDLIGSEADSRSGYLSYALDLRMDTLSLQLRVIKQVLQVDKVKAREMFNQIKSPKLKPLTCEDMTVYDLKEFYEVFGQVIKSAFSDEEVRKEEPLNFLIDNMQNVDSPLQVNPTLKLIAGTNLPPSQLQILINVFAERLDKLSVDDRAFGSNWRESAQSLRDVVDICIAKRIITGKLLSAYRGYLVNHLSASRCFREQNIVKRENEVLLSLNKLFLSQSVATITDKEATSTKPQKKVDDYVYFRGATKAKQIMNEVSQLHWLPDTDIALSESDKHKIEWQLRLRRVFNLIQEWKPKDEETEADYFHQKAGIYRTLLEFVPDETSRENIMKEYFIFLIDSPMQQEKRVEWFYQLNNITRLLKKDNNRDRALIEALFSNTSNSVINLYARLEKINS